MNAITTGGMPAIQRFSGIGEGPVKSKIRLCQPQPTTYAMVMNTEVIGPNSLASPDIVSEVDFLADKTVPLCSRNNSQKPASLPTFLIGPN